MSDERRQAPGDLTMSAAGRLVLLTEPWALDELDAFGELPVGVWQRHSGRLEDSDDVHFRQTIVSLSDDLLFWGGPAVLAEERGGACPSDASAKNAQLDSAEGVKAPPPTGRGTRGVRRPAPDGNKGGEGGDLWRRLLHRLKNRLLVRVVLVGEDDDLATLLESWQERFQRWVLPEIQSDLRAGLRQVIVLVFLRDVCPADEPALSRLMGGAGPGGTTDSPVEAPVIVPPLLRAYVMGPRLRAGLGEEAPPVLSRHVWPLAVSRLLLRLMVNSPPHQKGPRLWAWRCMDFSPNLNQQVFDELLNGEWSDLVAEFLKPPDTLSVEQEPSIPATELPPFQPPTVPRSADLDERMARFTGLEGARECEEHVERETSDQAWKEVLSSAGTHFRAARNQRDRDFTFGLGRLLSGRWQRVAESPAGLTALGSRGLGSAGGEDVPERLEQQHQRWEEMLRRGSGLFERKEHLRDCARELDRARRGFVGSMARVLFALLAALLLAFSASAVARLWMTAWPGGAGPGDEVKTGLVYLGVIVAVALGCAAGVLLPWRLEARRGRRAGRHLQRQLGLLRGALLESIQDRHELCAAGDELRLASWLLASSAFQRRLAIRTDTILQHLLRVSSTGPAGGTPPPAQEAVEPFRSSILRQKDRRDYRRGSTLRLGKVTDQRIRTVLAAGIENRRDSARRRLAAGWQACCECDRARRGWLPWRVLDQKLGSLALQVRDEMESMLAHELISAERLSIEGREFARQLRQCFGQTRVDWPFLSVPALPAREATRHPVFLATRPGVDPRAIENELRAYYQADVTPMVSDTSGTEFWHLPIYAFVFEEMSVEVECVGEQVGFRQNRGEPS